MKDETNITKPISIAKDEYINNIVQLTNESHLPYFIVEYILKEFLKEVHTASQRQLEIDRQEYLNQLTEAAAEQKKDLDDDADSKNDIDKIT